MGPTFTNLGSDSSLTSPSLLPLLNKNLLSTRCVQTPGSTPGASDEQQTDSVPALKSLDAIETDRQMFKDKQHIQITASVLRDLKDRSRCDDTAQPGKGHGEGERPK